MLVEFVHDFCQIELEQAPTQANTLIKTFAAQKVAADAAQAAKHSHAQPLLALSAEEHTQPPLQIGSDMLVVGECLGDKRKADQIAILKDDDGAVEADRKQRPEAEKSRKSLVQALNIRIDSGKSSRCVSPAP